MTDGTFQNRTGGRDPIRPRFLTATAVKKARFKRKFTIMANLTTLCCLAEKTRGLRPHHPRNEPDAAKRAAAFRRCEKARSSGAAPSAKRVGRRKVRGWVPAVRKARGQSRLRIKKRISAGCRFISPPGHAERAPAAAKGMRQTPGAKFQPFPFILHTSGPDAVRTIPQRRRSLVFQTYVKKSSSGAGGQ